MRAVGLLLFLLTMSKSFDARAEPASQVPHVAAAAIRYTIRFPRPATHVVEVEAEVPTAGQAAIDLDMAVWTPGSYLVREYSRNVERVEAFAAGKALTVNKTSKNRWHVTTGGAAAIVVKYRVYGREMSVRNNYIDTAFALINGAATFLTLAGDTGPRPHEVTIEPADGWKTVVTPLQDVPGGPSRHVTAPDFDTLVDSPIVVGNPAIYPFTVQGKPHYLVNLGEGGVWDGQRTATDVQRIVEEAARFWGTIPYDKYVFFNLITQANGGLEHKNACTLMSSRWSVRTRRGYVDWLTLVTHEFFHAWNVKRLRPVELGPFDYLHENPTRMLWVAEGFTDYYGDLLAVRAGVITRDEFLADISSSLTELNSTPGRQVMPVEQASQDAWIRYYRPDENSPNVAVSYYTKGAIIGLLLDAEIRRVTSGAKSLDDVMRLAWQRYSGARGYTSAEFRGVVSEVAGHDLSAWLARAADSTEELDYTTLGWYGLRVRADAPSPTRAWIGLATSGAGGATLRNDGGRLVVSQVRRGSPAEDAGVSVEDEIVAIGGYRVRPEQWESRLETWTPGDTVPLLVARREELLTLQVTFAAEPALSIKLEPDPSAASEARDRLTAWLKP